VRRNEESDRVVALKHEDEGGPDPSTAAEPRQISGAEEGPRRKRQAMAQFPMQILVPEETRDALRQRSLDTGASIRHIILRSLAADGFPVPKLSRWRE
jgi:hypothetical protein